MGDAKTPTKGSVEMSVLERLDDAITALAAVRDELAQTDPKPAEAPDEPAVPSSLDAEQVATAESGHDNSLPFKCPACGKTYTEQVACTNGHPAEQTQPTAEVLGTSEPVPADGSDGSSSSSSQPTLSADTPDAGSAKPATGPTWPT